jgi:tRNA(Arg) A34 adenosine deaminase TadA
MNWIEQKVVDAGRKAIQNCPRTNKSFHAAILTYKDYIVSVGINKETCNDDLAVGWTHKKVHAEFMCVRRFRRYNSIKTIGRLTLYSLRFLKDGHLANAKPCRVCGLMLSRNSPKRVIYSSSEGELIEWIK